MNEFRPIVGKASVDGVTVEVGIGGRLRSVQLESRAMRYGAAQLAAAVVSVAARATAKANQQYAQTLGRDAAKVGGAIGLGYDPELAADDDFERDWTLG